jgi:ring-1,2-phenylacetyl-CoA epoxidase subunit PaaA
VRISAEESFHVKQGEDIIITLATGTPEQRAMAQDAINRWWWPSLMMFGLHDQDSPNTPALVKWGIKTKTNDELRQTFVNRLVPELAAVGLTVPDPELVFDEESGNWLYGPIDWDEFWQVVRGHGPCNQERMAVRRQAHEEGAWVREALAAYAEKYGQGD